MGEADVTIQSLLGGYFVPILVFILIVFLWRKYSKSFRDWVFAKFTIVMLKKYHINHESQKKLHFQPLHDQDSCDPEYKNKGILRVLEIGAGGGANFQFFPNNCELTVVEPNEFFKPAFFESQSKHPDIKLHRFVVGCAEDMKDVESESIDAVVSTLVLCSVADVMQVLKEVKRILAVGGKFYFWEHVHERPGSYLHTIQNLMSMFIWPLLFDNCQLNRNIDDMIAKSGFSSLTQNRFYATGTTGLFQLIKPHARGIATK
ncbi:thiol S-methyltransferase TMT1A-like [Artemia franciscana]|uniref:Methyltransferase type 11 domain-containing protein n=1 Tax=Artemia franciscana TaxID=6661 RepID=A0AA88HLY3_ARTSF|nr:hypothetical protein QYM36_015578 [Artemia franciscana]